jgi:hypothetical protein
MQCSIDSSIQWKQAKQKKAKKLELLKHFFN